MADSQVEAFLDSDSEDEKTNEETFLNTVYVGGISYKAKVDDVKRFFKDCGKIKAVKYPISVEHKGSAFITFATTEAATEAVELSGAQMMERKLNVKYRHKGHLARKPPGCRIIFVNNLNFKSSEAQVNEFFSGCGEIVDVRIPTKANGFRFGKAYVEFVDTESVDKAMKLDGSALMGRDIKVNWALPDTVEKTKKKINESHTLVLASLPFNYSVNVIKQWFSKLGVDVTKCLIRLQKRPDGKSRGVAFVDFQDMEDLFVVLKQNDTIQGGRRVRIEVSLPKESRKRKRGDDENPQPKKKAKTWLEKIPASKLLRSFILHGAPRALEFSEIQSQFGRFKVESFARQKASVLVCFESRQAMGKALESVNGSIVFNKSTLKIAPAVAPRSLPSVACKGLPKIHELTKIREALESKFAISIDFCYRVKKVVHCECEDKATQLSLLGQRNESVLNSRVAFSKH